MMLTYKYRLKDKSSRKHLVLYAQDVNFVWNYCCEIQKTADRWGRKWPAHYDLVKLTIGTKGMLGIGSETISEICRYFVASRNAIKKCPRFRSGKYGLGWVPTKGRFIKAGNGRIEFGRKIFRYWNSRQIEGEIKTINFVQDARGRWYICFQCEVKSIRPTGNGAVGIDLGLKALATLSTGESIPNLRNFRQHEQSLAVAHRAGNKRRVRAIHAKIANARKHQHHVITSKIVKENGFIAVGNVSASKLKKTRFAKSVSDAGWTMFRNQLAYKASMHRAVFVEADERYSSVTCSSCKARSGPQGQKGLRVRQWECGCGAVHDRDQNAAQNILIAALECQRPVVGIAA